MSREYVRFVICSKKKNKNKYFRLPNDAISYTHVIGADINGSRVSGENANWQHVLNKILHV